MAEPRKFFNDLHDQTQNFLLVLSQIQTLKDRLDSDAGLAAAAASAAVNSGRTDLATIDFTNWNSAVTQFLFTFNSGAPTQKSFLYKVL